MIFKSLRWRLQVWHGVLLVGVLTGFGATAYQLQRAERVRLVEQELSGQLRGLLRTLREGPRGRGGRPPRQFPGPPGERGAPSVAAVQELFAEALVSRNVYFCVWDREGQLLIRSADAPADLECPDAGTGDVPEVRRQRGEWRETYSRTPPGECLLVGRSFGAEDAALHAFAGWLALAGTGVLALGLAGGWWLVGRAIRPIGTISATAGRIAAGRLSERIDAAAMDTELGGLANVLNDTFARLDAAFVRQQQFTADASHELRTPVSVILSQTQLALGRDRPAAEYRETIGACQRAAQRMRRLIESLLELARLDSATEATPGETVRLDAVVAECAGLIGPLAEERRLVVRGESGRLGQAVTNLLANAVHYNRPAGEIRIRVWAEGSFAMVSVADTGMGIAAEHLPQLFSRFFRADAARTQGGAGLGLAIVQAIAQAHGGSVSVVSEVGVGSTFTLRLPAPSPAAAPVMG